MRHPVYINNVAAEEGLDSPKHIEHPKIKTSYKNLCILLVHLHITKRSVLYYHFIYQLSRTTLCFFTQILVLILRSFGVY